MNQSINWKNWNSKNDNFAKYKSIKSNLIYGSYPANKPIVSIMLITYKRANKLVNALNSAINQDYSGEYEIVVCDDYPYDKETDLLMKEYCNKHKNILYYRNEKNIGQYANWNRACELCRTEWYCLLHDDDQLKSNYLTMVMKCICNTDNVGLIGVYEDPNDCRISTNTNKSIRFIDKCVNAFIQIRKGKAIELSLADNIKHIYVMNSTFINKSHAIEIGGLDDCYYPSSDFDFSAKMTFYNYKTLFLPLKLVNKGIGESASLDQKVCDDALRCAYMQTYEMCQSVNYSDKKSKRKASIATVIAEIGVRGYNNTNYGSIKNELNIKKYYNNKIIIFLINLYSKVNWGLLLFQK